MDSLQVRIFELISRYPLWAITPDSFAALIAGHVRDSSFVGVPSSQFEAMKPISLGKSQTNKVTVIPVQGTLTRDCSWCGTTYSSIANAAEEAAADAKVKKIVLAVDSPGGEVTGLPETAAMISQVAKVKPVHAMVEGHSASAAYWLTTQASDITIAPSAEVGSVGVRIMHADVSKMLSDMGINVTEMHAGKFKTEWSPFKPLTEEAQAEMQRRLDAVHGDFLKAVGQGRGARATADIAAARFGEGRMFSADDAMGHGLADAVQSPRDFYRAITPAAEEENPIQLPGIRRARLDIEKVKANF